MADNVCNLKIVSVNARGLNKSDKRVKLFTWLKDRKTDIVFLQETFCTCKTRAYFNSNWKGKVFHSLSDSSHSRGVCILISEKLNFVVKNEHSSIDGRRLLINGSLENEDVSLSCIYAPNNINDRKLFFNRLKRWLNLYAQNKSNLIIGGDFNCCLNEKDRVPNTHLNDKSRKTFHDFINQIGLKDTWNVINPQKPGYTYIDKRTGTKSRLDYIFTGKHINLTRIKNIICPIVPDHNALCLVISRRKQKKGPGYWKMNASLIKDPDFKNIMISTINETIDYYQNQDISKQLVWEMMKINIKSQTIKFAQQESKKEKVVKIELQSKLNELQEKYDNKKINHEVFSTQQEEYKNLLNDIYDKECKGAQIRSKVKWIEEGEKPSSYFLNLEKSRQRQNAIQTLNYENEDTHDEIKILECCVQFYRTLYTSQNIDQTLINDYLNNIKTPILSPIKKEICEKPLSITEFNQAVKKLKQNKSPGLDGIVPEFYKEFWPNIKNIYMDMVNETFINGKLPQSLTKAIITLIYKKGDPKLLKNYRPISLTNYDYKLIAFVLANRLQNVIKDIIHPDQTGYIKKRFIGINARIIQDIFDYCEEKNTSGAVLCLDFEKAFDRIEWNFIESCLLKFNFGKEFIRWIRILYNSPTIILKNNGWLSNEVKMTRGIRQGCPISALLFIIAVEMMAISIRQNKNIEGFNFNQEIFKVSQYADDTTLLLSNVESIDYALLDINSFCNLSGMKMNIEKTEGLWLGTLKTLPNVYNGIDFSKKIIKCLGIYFGHDKIECQKLNWESKLKKAENSLHVWKSRKLTLKGKITILKTLTISKFIYNFFTLRVDENMIQNINTLMFNFIWNKRDRVKRNTMIAPYEIGGLRMIDVKSKVESIKASWITRLLSDQRALSILKYRLSTLGLDIKILLEGGLYKSEILYS